MVNNLTNFRDQPIELFTGYWIADDEGIVRRNDSQGMDIACVHPILPVQRLINIDDGTVRLKLMFRRDYKGWKEVVANKSTLFSSKEIKRLADKDISVSDKNASYLVEYLQDIEDLNHNTIPEFQSVSHLGWTSNGLFSPYMDNLEFDGLDNFRKDEFCCQNSTGSGVRLGGYQSDWQTQFHSAFLGRKWNWKDSSSVPCRICVGGSERWGWFCTDI